MKEGLKPYLATGDSMIGLKPRSVPGEIEHSAYPNLRKHSSMAEMEAALGSSLTDSYFVFALVRHPLSRICSFYNFAGFFVKRIASHWKMAVGDMPAHVKAHPELEKKFPLLCWHASRAYMSDSSFSGFVRNKHLLQSVGFQPQAVRLRRSSIEAPHCRAFRLEDRNDWMTDLRQQIGADFEFPHANITGERLITPAQVSAEDVRYLEAVHAEDFAEFGY
jgi:hypothetical protein